MANGTLLIGYDVESKDVEVTRQFLRAALALHERHGVPATMFLVGRTVDANVGELQPFASHPLFDLQQHTYSHTLLKTVCMQKDDGEFELYRGGTLAEIDEDVSKATAVLRDRLGVACSGLCGPYCYYRGLMDRPDILEILYKHGIRFTRTYGRNERDAQPVSFTVQPFWYAAQGFPGVLEIPLAGWQDVYLRWKYGWEDVASFIDQLRSDCREVARRGAVWSFCSHDWSSIRSDPDMSAVEALIVEAAANGLEVMSHRAYFERCTAARS